MTNHQLQLITHKLLEIARRHSDDAVVGDSNFPIHMTCAILLTSLAEMTIDLQEASHDTE